MSRRILFIKDLEKILKEGGFKPYHVWRERNKTFYYPIGSPKMKADKLKYLHKRGLTYQPVDLFNLDDDYIISWKE